jgi:D-sedoheptulose 7-phosphate isomerase
VTVIELQKDSRVHVVRLELEQSAEVKRAIDEALCSRIVAVADWITNSQFGGGKLILFGNGGSAADAQHLAGELVGRYRRDRAPMRAISLASDAASLTSIANDDDFAEVFARQVRAWAQPGDVALGISTSGNSVNVVRGLRAARERGALAVALTGAGGGGCGRVADILLSVPSTLTPRIQEAHLAIGHILCGLVEKAWCERSAQ